MNTRLVVCLLFLSYFLGVTAKDRPNVLFIMSDDHTAQAVGAYAKVLKPLNPTPTLDKLAAEGMTFENAFCLKLHLHAEPSQYYHRSVFACEWCHRSHRAYSSSETDSSYSVP